MIKKYIFCLMSLFSIGSSTAVDIPVTTIADSGGGSFREAIDLAVAGDRIVFNIPGDGVKTIELVDQLPTITNDNITIDGYTQIGSEVNTATDGSINAVPLIQLTGNDYTLDFGLRISGDGCVVRGLIINTFNNAGIRVNGDNCIIAGNFIGTDPTGTQVLRNISGVLVTGDSNVIGGTSILDKNLIAGSAVYFVDYNGAVAINNSLDNRVEGNLIGLDKTGTVALGQAIVGVSIYRSESTIVGGEDPRARNIISGNSNSISGIIINEGTGITTIQNNYIGTDKTGSFSVPNGNGITIRRTPDTVINENVISGNLFNGIFVGSHYVEGISTDNTIVSNNKIGIDASGTYAVPNGADGIIVQVLVNQ